MPPSSNDIIVQVIAITGIFLIVACFLLVYVNSYNLRKKRHLQEKKDMQQAFEQELMKSQMEVQEQTLQTIASDIHDNVGQLLSLTRISLSTVNVSGQPDKAKEKIEGAMNLLDTSIKELRQLAAVLHAENLLKTGLQHAVERELERLSKAGDYETAFHSTGNKTSLTDPQTELIAFRIVQELLNNTIKHAAASRIEISFDYSNEYLRISVADNGRGFDTTASMGSGMGLLNLIKRTKMIGGDLVLESAENSGTKAVLNFPVKTKSSNE